MQIRRHNVIGDLLRCNGRISRKRTEDGRHFVDLIVWADTQRGELSLKVEATVELLLD